MFENPESFLKVEEMSKQQSIVSPLTRPVIAIQQLTHKEYNIRLLHFEDILKSIHTHCEQSLPSYARPVFVRFMAELHLTGTFKHQKVIIQSYLPL